MKQGLMIFVKNRVPGTVKTRLAATIGNEKAMVIYNKLMVYTASITALLEQDKEVVYADSIEENDAWDDRLFSKSVQQGNDLGKRMANAFEAGFSKGYKNLVIIGTDCFELTTGIIENAFAALATHDVVIGPAYDGGYYLLGMKAMHPALFDSIAWSTSKVLEQTVAACRSEALDYNLLETLSDIDDENDLNKVRSELLSIPSK